MSLIIDPVRMYMIGGQVSTIANAFQLFAAGNNQSVKAAVSGQRIRIMGYILQSITAVSTIQFKSASGGTLLTNAFYIPLQPADKTMIITDSGYFETKTGEGLFCDVTGGGSILMDIFYVTYTP